MAMILHWPTLSFSLHHPGPRSRGRPPSPLGTPSCDPPPGRPTPPGRCSLRMMVSLLWGTVLYIEWTTFGGRKDWRMD